MSRFTYRGFQPGDETAINELYYQVTSRDRSLNEYIWQWHRSPSGSADIWLIHDSDGDEKLIGHHGVMPIRFTKGSEDLIFGKIENTMVLPEYRSKILYPRFEIRFKEHYQNRYHALFATMGPDSALRIRKACGYHFPVEWQSYIMKTSVMADVIGFSWLIKKGGDRLGLRYRSVYYDIPQAQIINAGFLSSEAAAEAQFFDSFWTEARKNHGIAPRRDRMDLKWKFWDSPYKSHFTFIFDNNKDSPGYAIVSLQKENRFSAFLDDFAVIAPSEKNYRALFNALAGALNQAGIFQIAVISTSDPANNVVNAIFSERELFSKRIARILRPDNQQQVPRFITSRGQEKTLNVSDWGITGLVFEGRA